MCIITDSTERNQSKIQNVDLGNSILKYESYYMTSFMTHSKYGVMKTSNDMGPGRNLAKNRDIA